MPRTCACLEHLIGNACAPCPPFSPRRPDEPVGPFTSCGPAIPGSSSGWALYLYRLKIWWRWPLTAALRCCFGRGVSHIIIQQVYRLYVFKLWITLYVNCFLSLYLYRLKIWWRLPLTAALRCCFGRDISHIIIQQVYRLYVFKLWITLYVNCFLSLLESPGHPGAPDIPGQPRAPRGPVMLVTVGPDGGLTSVLTTKFLILQRGGGARWTIYER